MITVAGLEKSFGTQKVLDGVDLEIPRGEITAIIGPSGEGKSVFLKHLIGLLRPDGGSVVVDGEEITGMDRKRLGLVRGKFGMLFQNAALFDSMTVFENVAFPLEEKTNLPKWEIAGRVEEALEHVGLKGMDGKYPDELSGGMKKRVGLARVLITNPEIILFDEPTTGLDPVITTAIHRLIIETHARYGFTAVIVSHDIPEIFDVAHRIAVMYRGSIAGCGTAEEIRRSENPVVRQFISGSLDGPIRFLK